MKIKLFLTALLSLGLISSCNVVKDSNTSAESIKQAQPISDIKYSNRFAKSTKQAISIPNISYNGTEFNDRTELIIKNGEITQRIKASDLKIKLLDPPPYYRGSDSLPPENLFPGYLFFDYAIDRATGNVAVAVYIAEYVEIQVSAVFILKPQDNWHNYEIYPVQLPGEKALPDKFSSYSFSTIRDVSFIGSHLTVTHGDVTGFRKFELFDSLETSAGEYLGCKVTSWGERERIEKNICP